MDQDKRAGEETTRKGLNKRYWFEKEDSMNKSVKRTKEEIDAWKIMRTKEHWSFQSQQNQGVTNSQGDDSAEGEKAMQHGVSPDKNEVTVPDLLLNEQAKGGAEKDRERQEEMKSMEEQLSRLKICVDALDEQRQLKMELALVSKANETLLQEKAELLKELEMKSAKLQEKDLEKADFLRKFELERAALQRKLEFEAARRMELERKLGDEKTQKAILEAKFGDISAKQELKVTKEKLASTMEELSSAKEETTNLSQRLGEAVNRELRLEDKFQRLKGEHKHLLEVVVVEEIRQNAKLRKDIQDAGDKLKSWEEELKYSQEIRKTLVFDVQQHIAKSKEHQEKLLKSEKERWLQQKTWALERKTMESTMEKLKALEESHDKLVLKNSKLKLKIKEYEEKIKNMDIKSSTVDKSMEEFMKTTCNLDL